MVAVYEVTMAKADIVRVEVRDAPITKGPLIGPVTAETGSYTTVISRLNPNSGQMEYCVPVGADKTYWKFGDTPATAYLDRAAADIAGNYGTIGGKTVTAVYRMSYPYDAGRKYDAVAGNSYCTSSKHYLYLQLSAALPNGSHTISFPAGTGLANYNFVFNDKVTRSPSIQANQHGHRPADVCKLGHLSLWLPGGANEGAVQFTEATFHLIDQYGGIVYTGTISQRVTPTTVEENGSLQRYVSLNTTPLTITGITNASPGVVTYTGSGYVPANGDVLIMRGIGGLTALESATIVVANVNTVAKTFQIGAGSVTTSGTSAVDTSIRSGWAAYAAGTYLAGYDSQLYKTYQANRCGTYVYGMDFSSEINLPPNVYRFYVPGIGVGDPFRLDNAVHLDLAKIAMGGMFSHREGMAIDGRFGYTRPINFKDGVNGCQIFLSNLPAAFATEGQQAKSVSSDLGGQSPWITATRMTGWFGGHENAGDWDQFLYGTVAGPDRAGTYTMLDLGYEFCPSNVRATNFGVPKSSVTIGSDYAGTDALPDIVHEVIWHVDVFRRFQNGDGSVHSGIGLTVGGGTNDAGTGPSYVPVNYPYILAPDHPSAFAYCITAAKLAIILKAAGFTTIGTAWQNSAINAWTWAEDVFQHLKGHAVATTGAAGNFAKGETITGGTSGATATVYRLSPLGNSNSYEVIDIVGTFTNGETITGGTSGMTATLSSVTLNASLDFNYHYETALGVKTKGSLSTATFKSNLGTIQANADGRRGAAAAVLFRLTSSATYQPIAEAYIGRPMSDENATIITWEYYNSPAADSTKKAACLSQLTSSLTNYIGYSQGVVGYRNMGIKPTGTSIGFYTGFDNIIRRYILTSDVNCLDCLQAGSSFIVGANQYGYSMTVGVGVRGIMEVLHPDTKYAGQNPPDGITIYGWQPGFSAINANYGSDSPLIMTVEYPTGSFESTFGTKRITDPYHYARPEGLNILENRFSISQMEYTWAERISPQIIVGLWNHSVGGNIATTRDAQAIRRTVHLN